MNTIIMSTVITAIVSTQVAISTTQLAIASPAAKSPEPSEVALKACRKMFVRWAHGYSYAYKLNLDDIRSKKAVMIKSADVKWTPKADCRTGKCILEKDHVYRVMVYGKYEYPLNYWSSDKDWKCWADKKGKITRGYAIEYYKNFMYNAKTCK